MAAPTSHQTSRRVERDAARSHADEPLPGAELRFRAMGTEAHIVVTGPRVTGSRVPGLGVTGPDPATLAAGARRRLEQLEARWSRFRPDSEVSRLSAAAGRWVEVSADTVRLVRTALEGWRLTAGRFDPTVLGPLVRAGYTHDLDALRRHGPATAPLGVGLGMDAGGIEVDPGAVRLPAGVGFDAGGIGKGLAADVVYAELVAQGAEGACVNVGGDLRAGGIAPHGGGWTIAVEHVGERRPVCLLGIGEGAVATSTTRKRVWSGPDGRACHHLIDPFTGAPSDSDVVTAAVVAGQAWAAEVLATAALLRGSAHAFDVLPAGIEGLCIDRGGTIRSSRGLSRYLGDAPLPPALPPTTWEAW